MERYSEEYYNWINSLNAGDEVDILHPWEDGEVTGGKRISAVVMWVRATHTGGLQVFIEGFGSFFNGTTGYKRIVPKGVEA